MNFDAFVKDITDNNWKVFGSEVYVDGKLAHSFGDTTGIHELYSATKTVLSVAFGIAYDEGLIDPARSVLDYIPKKYVDNMPEHQVSSYRKITLERLLTMSVAGIPFVAEGDDWIAYSLACEIDPDEKVFNYSNINSYLVGVCLTEAIGRDLGDFIEERVFRPLGIEKYEYGRSPEGYFYGASRMLMSVHDLSKIGLLLYNGGVYEGRRIVSEEYVKIATSVRMMNREGGYGYFIWKYRDGFSINGKWKQKCYVLPKQGIIVTYLADIRDDSHDLLESMERNILGVGDRSCFEGGT